VLLPFVTLSGSPRGRRHPGSIHLSPSMSALLGFGVGTVRSPPLGKCANGRGVVRGVVLQPERDGNDHAADLHELGTPKTTSSPSRCHPLLLPSQLMIPCALHVTRLFQTFRCTPAAGRRRLGFSVCVCFRVGQAATHCLSGAGSVSNS